MRYHTPPRWGNIAAAALLCGLLLVGVGGWTLLGSLPTTSWPSTSGVVEESRVQAVGRNGPDEARVSYRYAVAGRAYTGARIGYVLPSSDAGARTLASRYSPGTEVRVYYDPGDPARAVLRPGGAGRGLLVLLAGAGLLAVWRHALARARSA